MCVRKLYKTDTNGREDSLRWPRDTLDPQKLALISPTSNDRPVGIGRFSGTQEWIPLYDRSPNSGSDYVEMQL
jgi:hypothetical protein